MIEDHQINAISILKSNKNCIIFKNKNRKFVCKTLYLENKQLAIESRQLGSQQIPLNIVALAPPLNQPDLTQSQQLKYNQHIENTLHHLRTRQKLNHNSLIQFSLCHDIVRISEQKYSISLIHQHYYKLLDDCLSYTYQQTSFDDDEIINTFEPIIDVVEYLFKQNIPIYQFSAKNIVITEDQNVKFIESFLLLDEISLLKQKIVESSINIYEQIANTIFKIILPTVYTKSWKNKLRLLKQKRSKQICLFLSMILSKCPSKGFEKQKKIKKCLKVQKVRKINKKQNIEDVVNPCNKEDNKMLIDSISLIKHQGKQNKLYQ